MQTNRLGHSLARSNQTMTRRSHICAATLIAILPACTAQTTTHKKKPDPKPEPTEPELVEYIRGSLLAYSPQDGINDNVDVTFDPASNVLKIAGPAGHCDEFLGALNANQAVWDVFDPSDPHQEREKLLRLTLVSVSGKVARTCYDKDNHVDAGMAANRARLLFSLTETENVAKFQETMTKAVKKLIVLCGGTPEKDLF
jgi:hypothetical protein